MKQVKIGVAGVGVMGQKHCETLEKLGSSVEFTGVYDINQQLSKAIANQFKVQSFKTYQDLLNHVDAVIIATSSSFHFPLITQAIEKEKHILVEKPFVTTLSEAEEIKENLKDKNIIFQVGHIERFNPALQHLKRVFCPDELISIEATRSGQIQRNIDIDVIQNLMIHDIDAVLSLIDSPVENVFAEGISLKKERGLDIVYAILSFKNGAMANLVANRVSKEKVRMFTITESDKVIKVDFLTGNLHVYKEIKPNEFNNIEKIPSPNYDPLRSELIDFVQSIRNNKKPLVGINDAIRSLEVALRIKEAISYEE